MRIIRASEIGIYLYCQRAWWYQIQGVPSENQVEMLNGQEIHARHGRNLMTVGCLRLAAYFVLLTGILLLAAYLAMRYL